jgi:hypothetical protein
MTTRGLRPPPHLSFITHWSLELEKASVSPLKGKHSERRSRCKFGHPAQFGRVLLHFLPMGSACQCPITPTKPRIFRFATLHAQHHMILQLHVHVSKHNMYTKLLLARHMGLQSNRPLSHVSDPNPPAPANVSISM